MRVITNSANWESLGSGAGALLCSLVSLYTQARRFQSGDRMRMSSAHARKKAWKSGSIKIATVHFRRAAIEYENRIFVTFRLVSGGVPLSDVSFMGQTLANHSYVDLSLVGSNDSDSVECHTDLNTCCSNAQGIHRGDWYSPDSTNRLPISAEVGDTGTPSLTEGIVAYPEVVLYWEVFRIMTSNHH